MQPATSVPTPPQTHTPATDHSYSQYLDPSFALLNRLEGAFREERIKPADRNKIIAALAPLRIKHEPTFNHCIRVGLVAREIASFLQLDTKAMLFAGLLHDVGKALCPLEILTKTSGWTTRDSETMKRHVMDGHRLVRDVLDFSAEVMLWHHRFQPNGYPVALPRATHPYSLGTKSKISQYGRVLSLADTFDALHRINDRNGDKKALSGAEIKAKMFEYNPDEKALLEKLYRNRILKTYIAGQPSTETDELDNNEMLYEESFLQTDKDRSPRNTRRHLEIACALEPVSDKHGCTTRFADASRHLSLSYFIVAGINLGDAFEDLAKSLSASGKADHIYEHTLRAQAESKRNRRGGRVNQGIIELLTPIVAAQHLHDNDYKLSATEILLHARNVLDQTSPDDVAKLVQMKELAHKLSKYDREVPKYPEAQSVLHYYKLDLAHSDKATSIAHNAEFISAFPTVKMMHDTLAQCPYPHFSERVQEAYHRARVLHDEEVGSGFLADCIAAAIYLRLSQDPTARIIG